jgi:hypothetical protein
MKERRSIVVDNDVEAAPLPTRLTTSHPQALTHMGVLAFVKFHRLPSVTAAEASGHGRTLAAKSRSLGFDIQKIPDARYGCINAYDVHLLMEHFGVKT